LHLVFSSVFNTRAMRKGDITILESFWNTYCNFLIYDCKFVVGS
jgi:hypothetical protein